MIKLGDEHVYSGCRVCTQGGRSMECNARCVYERVKGSEGNEYEWQSSARKGGTCVLVT